MGTGSLPSDQAAFFASDIGQTRTLAATTVSAPLTERLTPGRWLIQIIPDTPAAIIWINVGDFDPATPLVATAGAGNRRIPLSAATLISVEFNVRKDYNDALAAICSAGTATIYITNVARRA